MKQVLFWILFFSFFTFPQSKSIKNFDAILQHLKAGNSLRCVLDYSKCKLIIDSVETESPDVIGGMPIAAFEFFAKGSIKNEKAFVTFSETSLISHRRYGYVLNYVKIRIFDDESVEIIARYLDPKSYEIKMDETFWGKISESVFIYESK